MKPGPGPKWSLPTHGTMKLLAPAMNWGNSGSVGIPGIHSFIPSLTYSFIHKHPRVPLGPSSLGLHGVSAFPG